MVLRFLSLIVIVGMLASCKHTEYVPKPAGYFRVDTPATHVYQLFDKEDYPFTFEYPVYSTVEKSVGDNTEKLWNKYWFNINMEQFRAAINFTYLHPSSKEELVKMVNDAYGLSAFHQQKADFIKEENYTNKYGVTGVIYTIGGSVASPMAFTATDSLHHFLRGALYFDVTPNADSLKPATTFVERDINKIIETIRFK